MARQTLRRKLLLWLLLPLLLLILMDSTLLFRIAMHFQHKAFDHALSESALNIAELVSASKDPGKPLHLGPRAPSGSDQYQADQIYYNIFDLQGHVIGGDPRLALLHSDAGKPYFYSYARIQGKLVRVVKLQTSIMTTAGRQDVIVQVAETLNKREHLADQFLIGIVVPQLALVMVAVGILWFGIGRGLQPLWDLHSALAQRSHRDLRPVVMTDIPGEVRVLVDSVNLLISQLKNVLESQNRFIADAAHQLRTPLAAMQAQLELTQQEVDPQLLKRNLATIGKTSERLTHLVRQLLMLARNQPEALHSIELDPLNLVQLAQQVTMDMVPSAYNKGIDLGFDCHHDELMIVGAAQRLKEMLYNLIDNAIRYSPSNARVTVSLESVGQQVVLHVVDNGSGIPLADRDKVFERFHRVIGTNQEGSGLGLAIVMEIANLHHATIQLQPGVNGEGTHISLSFARMPQHLDQTGTPVT